ncbi:TolC family protein [Burkholderia multivorans]|uniref:TolC family protein n=1 Tax=Burkholderia multivorans TaxID=87883 RepID=UPI000AE251E9|nr:TolC family protein [Burkholderia multivorans]MCL4647137.1 TolC family protein [Burkholderia multivorans]MDN7866947.1 TolC family protein [Burkholderia multivorans]UQN89772.1 TolC family protein [Burkholderia multivorans]UQO74959.1 TolC family protein [Burkholderia multivorans]UQP29220.1 TolC family protein [Burkholderia multivorans]
MSVEHNQDASEHMRRTKVQVKRLTRTLVTGLLALFSIAGVSDPVWAFDPLRTSGAVSATASGAMLDNGATNVCIFGPLPRPLPLQNAVERSLCNNPKTREAWAQVKIQTAGVGIGRAAYLPTVSATWQGVRDETVTNITGLPQYSSVYRNSALRTDSVSLSWVLYDFGGRSAALRNATALLAVAQANQQAALETAFANVAKDYYAAQAAQGAFAAADEIEQTANGSFKAATVRVDKGISPISDELQAQTSWAEAVVERTKALGAWQTALGSLASDMNLDPDIQITLPDVGDGVAPDGEFNEAVADLIQEAKRSHPSVVAAQEQVAAAVAKVSQTRAAGLPSLSLVAKYSENNEPTTLQIGVPQFPTTGHEWYLGFQLTIPIFEGFGRTYQIRQDEAQVEFQRDALDEVQQQVGLDVWTSYQALQTATHNIGNSATLLDVARRSYTAAQHRYQGGVGNILELLNAQSSMAAAKRQRIQALTDWRSARLQLAAKLGKLGMWSLADDASVSHR